MKRLLAILLALVMIFAIAACNGGTTTTTTGGGNGNNAGGTSDSGGNNAGGGNTNNSGGSSTSSAPPPPSAAADEYELALITDLGTIDDKSFNQGAWEGLVKYAEENNIPHKYYKPADQGDDAYLNAIDQAVQGGAKVIVTPGYLFEVPIFHAQDRYPGTKFILLDGSPHAGDYNVKVSDNTVAVFYAEEQAGFLAGYAAVKDGYRKLGFMGGIAVPAVIRFGIGYVQGAEVAAQELGLPDGSVTLNYFYTDTFAPSPDIQTRAAAWFNEGVEVIFSCGGGICFSIFPAAEQAGKSVIGVDVDQSGESATVISSATKGLTVSVYDCLVDYYAGKFPGGQILTFSASNYGVGLPMGTSKFKSFTQADYDAIYAKLQNGSVKVDNNIDVAPDKIPASKVAVSYFN